MRNVLLLLSICFFAINNVFGQELFQAVLDNNTEAAEQLLQKGVNPNDYNINYTNNSSSWPKNEYPDRDALGKFERERRKSYIEELKGLTSTIHRKYKRDTVAVKIEFYNGDQLFENQWMNSLQFTVNDAKRSMDRTKVVDVLVESGNLTDAEKQKLELQKTVNKLNFDVNSKFIVSYEKLLEKGHKYSSEYSDNIRYPIFAAISNKNYKLAEKLIDAGAYLNVHQRYTLSYNRQLSGNLIEHYITVGGLKYVICTQDRVNKTFTNFDLFEYYKKELIDKITGKYQVDFTPIALAFAHFYANPENTEIKQLINKMLTKGADLNYPVYKDDMHNVAMFNPMCNAIYNNDYESVKLLVDNKMFLNRYFTLVHYTNSPKESKKKYRIVPEWSYLEMAENTGNSDIVNYLKENGAIRLPEDHHPQGILTEDKGKIFLTSGKAEDVYCVSNTKSWISGNYSKAFMSVYTQYNGDVNKVFGWEGSLLKFSLKKKRIEAAKILIENGAVVTVSDIRAVLAMKDNELLDLVLKNNKSPHLIHSETSVFMELLRYKKYAQAKQILNDYPIDKMNKDYRLSCLAILAVTKNIELTEQLLQKVTADEINSTFNELGNFNTWLKKEIRQKRYQDIRELKAENIFFVVVKYSTPEIANLYLKNGVDVNYKIPYAKKFYIDGDYDASKKMIVIPTYKESKKHYIEKATSYYTPFVYYCKAVKNQNAEMLKVLVKNGADINYACPISGVTGVYFVKDYMSLKYLIEKGVDLNRVNLTESYKPTVLFSRAADDYLEDYEKIMELLLTSGADKEFISTRYLSKKKKQFTVKKFILEEGDEKVLKYL